MKVFIASPSNQMHAHAVNDMSVLLSFATWSPWLVNYVPTFSDVLLDSGAFSELNSGKSIDIEKYVDWVQTIPYAIAWAGLDNISGDWKRSLSNYRYGGFPTIHDADPPELLDELIPMACERGKWIGIGLKPPRHGKERWLRDTLARIPNDLHVHGFALGLYTYLPRLDSVDSTHVWLEWMKYRHWAPWLSVAECVEIAVKKVQRFQRIQVEEENMDLFEHASKWQK